MSCVVCCKNDWNVALYGNRPTFRQTMLVARMCTVTGHVIVPPVLSTVVKSHHRSSAPYFCWKCYRGDTLRKYSQTVVVAKIHSKLVTSDNFGWPVSLKLSNRKSPVILAVRLWRLQAKILRETHTVQQLLRMKAVSSSSIKNILTSLVSTVLTFIMLLASIRAPTEASHAS